MHLGRKGQGSGARLPALLWDAVCAGRAGPSLLNAGSLSPPALPGLLLAPNCTSYRVPNLDHHQEPTQQVIRGNGRCIFWFSATVINGKFITSLTSQFLSWVPARSTLRNLYQSSLRHLDWSDRTTAGLWRKGRWARQFPLTTAHSRVRQQI